MSFWTAVVIMVAIAAFSRIYRSRLKSLPKYAEEIIEDVEHRMDKIEERMANIETIVLEKEKEHRFDSI